MPEIIEIEGGLVRRKNVTVVAEQRLEDILPFMERRMPVTALGLPDNLVAIHYDEQDPTNRKIELLIQLPPKVRTLPLARQAVHPKVAIPWTIFHFSLHAFTDNPTGADWVFDYYRCFFARQSGQHLDQTIIPALLPNVFESGEICFGTTAAHAAATIGERINQIVNDWYLSNFNNIGHTRRNYLPWHSHDFSRWVEETERNPRCWEDWPEWNADDNTQQKFVLRDIFAPDIDVKATLVLPDGIPDIPVTPTFGTAEDWLRQLRPDQRYRLRVGLDNIAAEDPDAIQAPVEVPN